MTSLSSLGVPDRLAPSHSRLRPFISKNGSTGVAVSDANASEFLLLYAFWPEGLVKLSSIEGHGEPTGLGFVRQGRTDFGRRIGHMDSRTGIDLKKTFPDSFGWRSLAC